MKRFLKFCKEKGILHQVYVYKANPQWENPPSYYTTAKQISNILKGEASASQIFTYLFLWNKTKEGYNFWSDIENEWIKLCRNKEIKYFVKNGNSV